MYKLRIFMVGVGPYSIRSSHLPKVGDQLEVDGVLVGVSSIIWVAGKARRRVERFNLVVHPCRGEEGNADEAFRRTIRLS